MDPENSAFRAATNRELATFGGGCFWCTEAVFSQLVGVSSVESGYAGGQTDNPNYQSVCSGTTGHAEVVQVEFSSTEISYTNLLEVFFATHDPSQLNRQGADIGTQYRSVIFYHNETQENEAKAYRDSLVENGQTVITEILPYGNYYSAEDYHQRYFSRNPGQPYCLATIPPKLAKLKQTFAERELLKGSVDKVYPPSEPKEFFKT